MITYKTMSKEEFVSKLLPKDWEEAQNFQKDLSERILYSEYIFENVDSLHCVFAFDNDKIIGISKFGKYGFSQKYWALAFVSVDPQYQGQGISKELIRHTVKFLKEHNIKEFSLSSLEPEGKTRRLAENFYAECKRNGIELHLGYSDKELEDKLKSVAKMIRKIANQENDTIKETQKHIENVGRMVDFICRELSRRAKIHDDSKLKDPEFPIFNEYTKKLKDSTYGSEEYKQFLKDMKPALDHHYLMNRHHPEHFENGVDGMNIVDLIEMFCDWKAATLRHENGDLNKSIEINTDRFKLSPQLKQIFLNSVGLFDEDI